MPVSPIPTVTTLLQITSLEGSILLRGITNADFIGFYLELVYTIFEIAYRMLYK